MSGETDREPSGWTVDTLLQFSLNKIVDMQRLLDERYSLQTRMLDERYATQTKATDAAFVAQQTAMKTAFDAADKAVQAALAAAEKAAFKAEAAADKRFDATNEFREQQADTIARFLLRAEFEPVHKSLLDKVDENNARITERVVALELRLSSRIDLGAGKEAGQDSVTETGYKASVLAQAQKAASRSQAIAIASVFVAIIAVIVVVIIHFR